MRKEFSDRSFIELIIAGPGKANLSIGGKDKDNYLKFNINSVELSFQELSDLIAGLGIVLPPPNINKNSP